MFSAKRLEMLFWAATPSIVTLSLLILTLVPKHVAGLGSFMPLLPLIPIFYWGMLHAREMPYWFVFFVGMLIDAVSGVPLGVSSLLYVIFLALLHAQRKYFHKEGFLVKWAYFGALLLFMLFLNWVMISMLHKQPRAVGGVLIQWLLTFGCYPLLHTLFDRLARHISERRWQLMHGR